MRTANAIDLALAAACVFGASATEAQRQPEPFPWERKTNRLLQPKKIDQIERARRLLNRDIRKLTLPKNRIFGSGAEAAGTPPAPDADRHGRLDTNRDGFISRGEYLTGRTRPARAGAYGRARHNSRRSRLDSRFRAADRNRDGRLSTGELQGLGNRRF